MKARFLTPEEAMARAVALCSKCEQCSPDILKKLSAWGIASGEANKIIALLVGKRYLDDSRFARAYAHDKLVFNGWGRRKISQGLWAKRLSSNLIEEALDSLDEEEYLEVAKRVVASKVRSASFDLTDYTTRLKLLKSVMGRGFESQIVAPIIRQLHAKQLEDED